MISLQELRVLNALAARYPVADLIAANRNNICLSVYWRPDGPSGPRKVWKGIPSIDQITQLRLMTAAAIGRQPTEYRRTDDGQLHEAPDPRSPVGTTYCGFERIQTYKWTTAKDTGKPIPPNSFAWRDTITGMIYVNNPFQKRLDREQEKTA